LRRITAKCISDCPLSLVESSNLASAAKDATFLADRHPG
jgi:hypothetical protein